ncbi:hypothetical protein BH10PSE15_BH10PSE15_12390 [soil metagenome]
MDDASQIQARYYSHRAEQERAVAARSGNPEARRVHAELAARYEALRSTATQDA